MVVKPFSQRIVPDKVFEIQNNQYSERVLLQDTVPANTTQLGRVNISNLGHFFCMFITGHFTTLDAGPADNGISYLSGQLIDGAGQRKLFNERIPLDLWLSPGRRKSALVLGAAAGNNLFYPIEFEYLFTANSDILLDVENSSTHANSYEIVFHGIRIMSDMTVRNRIQPEGGKFLRAANQPNRQG